MDCFHKANPLCDSSLNEDVKVLAPKHYKYLIKLPEMNRCLKIINILFLKSTVFLE